MATVDQVPAGLPPAQQRPSSIRAADIYGSFATATPTTIVAGTSGGGRAQAASDQLDAQAPITVNGFGPDFLQRPAGILAILLVAILALSYFDR